MPTQHGIMDLRCFNYAGRMRRKPFLLWYFLTGLGGLVFALLLLLHLKLGQVHPILRWGTVILLLFFGFNLLAWTYSVIIQRLHDIRFPVYGQLPSLLGLTPSAKLPAPLSPPETSIF